MPLADKIRPMELDQVFGQTHILGENRPLKKIIESGHIPNMIFYGPSGVGKTTVANIIAHKSNMELHKLNGGYKGNYRFKKYLYGGKRHSALLRRDTVPEQKAAAKPFGIH